MPPTRSNFPKYQHHSSGQARVRLTDPDGRREDVLLGPYGSPESKTRYDREIAAWVARGRTLPEKRTPHPDEFSNASLLLAFVEAYGDKYDTRSSSGQLANLKSVVRIVRELFGREPARLMSPKRLKRIRSAMVAKGWSLRHVNQQISRVKSIYRWAVSEELIPGEVLHSLSAVKPLQEGEEGATSNPKVEGVHPHVVEMTLPRLSPPVRDIVRLMMLSGARCGELCILRPCDIDRSDSQAWVYQPTRHKTKRKGKDRFVYFGPDAQSVLLLQP